MQDNSKTDPQRIEILLSEAKGLLKNGARLNVLEPGKKRAVGNPRLRGITDITTAINYANRGYNLGFSPGDRLMVLDVDCKRGEPGLATADQMDLAPTHTVTTPSGGMHCYFGRPIGMSDYHRHHDKYPGIEFLGNGHNVVMAGSIVDGKLYQVSLDRRPVMLPDWLARDLDAGREPEEFGEEPEGGGNDLAELKRLLTIIPNTADLQYDPWNDVGKAIHHETSGSSEGYDLWVGWSATGPKHDEREMPKKWRSFGKRSGPQITIGTLRMMATNASAWGAFEDLGDSGYEHVEPDDVAGEEAEEEKAKEGEKEEADPGFKHYAVDDEFFEEVPEGRDWLQQDLLLRNYITVLAGAGGSAKSTLGLVTAMSIATGRDLLQLGGVKRGKVLMISNEESRDEFQLRMASTMTAHGVKLKEIKDRLHIISGYQKPILIAEGAYSEELGTVAIRQHKMWRNVRRLIRDNNYDAVILDPFANAIRGVNENSNSEISDVMTILRQTAADSEIGFILIHHASKSGGNADAATRGASAIVNSARIVIQAKQCTPKDLEGMGIPDEEAPFYVQLQGGKSNLGGRRGTHHVKIQVETVSSQLKGEIGFDSVATLVPVAQSLFEKNSSDPRAVIGRFIIAMDAPIVTQQAVIDGLKDGEILNTTSERAIGDLLRDLITEDKDNTLMVDGHRFWREKSAPGFGNRRVILVEKLGS